MAAGPLQVKGEVISVRRVGAYSHVTLLAPGIAERVRPGHFVALAVGDATSSTLLRRSFSIYRAQERGVYGGTVEVVLSAHGPGTRWLSERRERDAVDVVGPLGTPFTLPRDPASCTLVGGGYGSAPLFGLADALRQRGCRVDVVLGAATEERLFGVLDAKRIAQSVTVTTDDGSMGVRGRVTDVLPALFERAETDVVYACGPMPMLRAVAGVAAAYEVASQVAVEEAMACGIGVCMTCVLPVVGDDGVTRMVRSCTEGPVFRGESVRFDAVGTVPADAYGAPQGSGH
ncbi:dihydroorotate dehydrogenase electron transfer subunit [Motilibacter rhizosphaerae]|uniref:Dihydroorotate dehydrogenase electron transfer subunit n=1 Tax=Motilibacter rhizosphaerae TaxID=598652 RepID=A0A4Q7NQR9_9ACTN|nr:dihydroorotate dehydrogenase electron transfer subunit [Motilibacter rhizosphaerae]RZS89396.1 dihydroorotate dehydrogenase electron transfer subunit [Motilibacter rhizosphaerae]